MPMSTPKTTAMRTFLRIIVLLAALATTSCILLAQNNGIVQGRILDAKDGSPLWGANVMVKGTSLGASTDDEGRFKISNLPTGTLTLLIRYLGFEQVERSVQVEGAAIAFVEVKLSEATIQGEEITVTAQMKGQQAAINQQITSNSIINVVSQERIQELPDQNAAEAISRLPGISIQRDGGEGQKVILRGLEAKYTVVTVNGEKIPSTDEVDRSVDLSSVSTDMLAGIEVYKSYTADQDGDAVGGTINFAMKKAPEGFTSDIKVQGGYNGLERTYNDYKLSASLSGRFLDDAIGIIVTGNGQRVNRSSEGLQANYDQYFQVGQSILTDISEIRYRYGASLAADARLSEVDNLFLTGFWSKLDHNPAKRTKELNLFTSQGAYRFTDGDASTQLLVVGLSGNHLIGLPVLGALDLNWKVSGSRSDQETPLQLRARFYEKSIQNIDKAHGVDGVFSTWIPATNKAYLDQLRYDSLSVLDKNLTYQANGKLSFSAGSDLAGTVKFGGKYNSKSRDRSNAEMFTATFLYGSPIKRNYAYIDTTRFPVSVDRLIGTRGFTNPEEDIQKFLDGRFPGWPTLSAASLHEFFNRYRNFVSPVAGGAMFVPNPAVAQNSYEATEDIWALYLMSEINLGDMVMILPGVRYERTLNTYRTIYGQITTTPEEVPTLANAQDTTGKTNYGDWLPTIQVRYTPLDWLSIRASATKTLSRPNFFDLVPYEKFDKDAEGGPRISLGNPSLKRSASRNFDLFVSASNQYGLVSAGWFYKEISDVPYPHTMRIMDVNNDYVGWYVEQTVNAEGLSWVRGGEIELQANLLLLPSPFDGIIINGNISFMKSVTYTPSLLSGKTATGFDTVYSVLREGPMPGQADRIANLTLGYERGGFRGRVSLVLQGKIRTYVGDTAPEDGYTDTYYRWDLALQQKIIAGLSIFFNVYNLTNVRDKSFMGTDAYPTSELLYGRTAELGIRYKL